MPRVPKHRVAINIFRTLSRSSCPASGLCHFEVSTCARPDSRKEIAILSAAAKITITRANNFIAINLPARIFIRDGWRTKRLRSVPRVYSWAVWDAKIHSATIPRNIPTRLKPYTRPAAWLSSLALTLSPRLEFPLSELIIKKTIEVNSALRPPTVAIVPKRSEGLRSFLSSAITTRII